jgi:acetolactate synthase-1/2/3 large subunit
MDVIEPAPPATSLAWKTEPTIDVSDAIVASMAAGGVDHLFFTSGAEIVFYQEAIARAAAAGKPTPRLITMPHEHASLNAALGYAAVSGRPAATAAHVDAGTLNYGGAIHTAWRSGLPVLITAGGGPASYPGSMAGARDGGGHIWMQQQYDQNGIVRQYTKWDHRLEYQDNAGLIVSRALQVALTEPRGPVYLTIPKEIALLPVRSATYPTLEQLAVPRPAAPDHDGIRELAERLIAARNPVLVVAGSGRNLATVPELVALCEFLGISVIYASPPAYLSFPMKHPLRQLPAAINAADVVVALEANVPWIPGANEPNAGAYVAYIHSDPAQYRIPTYEFSANLRLTGDPLASIRALTAATYAQFAPSDRARIDARVHDLTAQSFARAEHVENDARGRATTTPIDPLWLSYQIGRLVDDNSIVIDETLVHNRLGQYMPSQRPGSYFRNPGSSGGWSPGAAFGAKLAAPDRDVIAVAGDGYYMFGTANPALWAANHYGAPYMHVIYQNRSWSTGTLRVQSTYPDSASQRGGFDGGYFDPPIDFAQEAAAAGAYGENVRDPAEVGPALRRGLEHTRNGKPAVISVWLAKFLSED